MKEQKTAGTTGTACQKHLCHTCPVLQNITDLLCKLSNKKYLDTGTGGEGYGHVPEGGEGWGEVNGGKGDILLLFVSL